MKRSRRVTTATTASDSEDFHENTSKSKNKIKCKNVRNESSDEMYENVSDEEVQQAQGRLVEAKKYLASIVKKSKKEETEENSQEGSSDDSEGLPYDEIDAEAIDREIIASRLQKDTLSSRGKAFESVSHSYTDAEASFLFAKCNSADGKVPTGVCIPGNSKNILYAITKGNCVYQYSVDTLTGTMKKIHTFRPSNDAKIDSFCSLAVSSCGKFLVAGSHSGKIVVWSVKAIKGGGQEVDKNDPKFAYKQEIIFTQHRGAILSLSFRRDDLTFYSASADRTIKVWSLATEPVYVDTLFGHQDSVASIASLCRESCISVGSRDRTARLWKVVEETQLVFRAVDSAGGSQDTVTLLEEESFLTGSDLGALSLWTTRRKKPLTTVFSAHPGNEPICALAALPFTDLVASGSGDGFIRLWRAVPSANELTCIREIPCTGYINSLSWSEDGKCLAAAVGKEQRLGRWTLKSESKNQVQLFIFKN